MHAIVEYMYKVAVCIIINIAGVYFTGIDPSRLRLRVLHYVESLLQVTCSIHTSSRYQVLSDGYGDAGLNRFTNDITSGVCQDHNNNTQVYLLSQQVTNIQPQRHSNLLRVDSAVNLFLIGFVYLNVTTYASYNINIIITEVQPKVGLCRHECLTHQPCPYYSSILSSGIGLIPVIGLPSHSICNLNI